MRRTTTTILEGIGGHHPSQIPLTLNKFLSSNQENGSPTFKFKSNAECAKYFEVTKVSVGRWINKNTPISTKKGMFLFTKAQDDIDT